jgi:hypothetical protein
MKRDFRMQVLTMVLVGVGSAGVLARQHQQIGPAQQSRREIARELACGVQSPITAPVPLIQVLGGPEPRKTLFGTGETIIISAGAEQGIKPGQEFFVRRVTPDHYTEPLPNFFPVSLHTAGWVRVTEVDVNMAYATVTHGCNGIDVGDFLEPFELPAAPTAAFGGDPDFAHPGHLIVADDRRQLAAPGDFVAFNRGSDHGLRPGQRLTVFRHTVDGTGPIYRVATATAMVIRPESSMIRIDTASSPIYVGDLVAIHR